MAFNNCEKIISQITEKYCKEKEIIRDLVNCERCSKGIVAWCYTCGCPIYKHEPICESSRDASSEL